MMDNYEDYRRYLHLFIGCSGYGKFSDGSDGVTELTPSMYALLMDEKKRKQNDLPVVFKLLLTPVDKVPDSVKKEANEAYEAECDREDAVGMMGLIDSRKRRFAMMMKEYAYNAMELAKRGVDIFFLIQQGEALDITTFNIDEYRKTQNPPPDWLNKGQASPL